MADATLISLSRRERQVMDALHRLNSGSVSDLMEEMPEDVSYSAVRAALRTLRDKGLVRHRCDGPRYVYRPAASPEAARRRALDHLVRTFFDGRPEAAAVALLGMVDLDLPGETVERIENRIRQAQDEGR